MEEIVMKTKNSRTIMVLGTLLVSLSLAACASPERSLETEIMVGQEAPAPAPESAKQDDLGMMDPEEAGTAPRPSSSVKPEEAAGLLYMREEEKLAHDLYLALYERWGLPIFSNIASSEATHTAAVQGLLEQFGLDDPAAGTAPGVFQDPTLQALYNDLISRGSESLAAALQAGALVEEVDLQDLSDRIRQTDHPQIVQVYSNLLAGSENHLRAFVQQYISRTGLDYRAQFLDASQVSTILAAVPGRSRGRGPN
jgi:hypothetical protein